MIYIEIERIFNLNRILLLAVGLWPYQRSKLVQLQLILFYGIVTSFVVFQFTVFITAECTLDLVIKIFAAALMFLTCVTKYTALWINFPTMRCLFEKLKHICNELNENEIAVMKKYSRDARRFTAIITLFTIGGLIIFSLMWPLLNIVLPINESRPHPTMQIMTEYFIDQDRYFYIILLHANAAICIGSIAVIATLTMIVGYLKQTCAMFSIASYRIEQAMKINMLENISLKNEIVIYNKIINAVDIHRKAMKFSTLLISNLQGTLILLTLILLTSSVLNSFMIIQAVLHGDSITETGLPIVFVLTIFIYNFLCNYTAQTVTDHNNHVFTTVYNVPWYRAPLRIQKMILFLLQRSIKTYTLPAGPFIEGSLENAMTLTSASLSYFTILYSIQQ